MAIIRPGSFSFPRQWDQSIAPSFPVEIDWNAQLSSGILCAFYAGSVIDAGRDICGNTPYLSGWGDTGIANIALTPGGPAHAPTAINQSYHWQASPSILNSATCSLVWYGYVNATTSADDNCLLAIGSSPAARNATTGGTGYGIRGVGNNTIGINSSGGVVQTAPLTVGLHSYCATFATNGGQATLYVDGVVTNTFTFSGTPTFNIPSVQFGSELANGTFKSILGIAYGRVLSAAEAIELTAQPFAMLRPVVRRSFFVAAAAATFVPGGIGPAIGTATATWTNAVPTLPQQRSLLPPSTINVPVNAPPFGGNDFNQPQVYTALGSWTPGPDAPRQTLRPLLPASITAVPVNAPPVRGAVDKQQRLAHPSWLPADPPPATQRFFFTVSGAVAVQPPFGQPWLSSALGSWQPPLDAPRQTPPTQIVSVDQPSPHGARDKQKRMSHPSWLPVEQPPAPRSLLPASITAVPVNNPPGILPVWQSGVLSGWLPGPDAPRQTSPTQIVSVDQPPPATAPRNNAAWTWQAPDAPRQLPAFAPIPGAAAVASYVWPLTNWTSAVLASWTLPPDPPRQLVNLAPALTAVPVNNPPGIGAALAAIARPVWDVDPFALRFAVRFPQAAVAAPAFQPGSAWLWQSTALSSWMPAVLPPQQVRPSYLLSVDLPPASPPRNNAVLWTWQTPDGPPTQFRPVQISSVDPPPATPPRNHAVLASWQPLVGSPWQARPSYLLSVDQPPARHQRNNAVLWTWQAPDRPPAQSRPMAPYGTAAIPPDPPPPRSVAWVTGVLSSWQPVGVMPQRWQPVFPPAVVPSGPTAPLAPAASRTVRAPGAVRYTASPGAARYTAAPAGPRTTNA